MNRSERINPELSNSINVFKAIAILSVICAHMPINKNNIIEIIRVLFSTTGVAGFFIFAGYFYNFNENIKVFWKKKFIDIIVPWILCSMLTFAVSAILNYNFEVSIPHYFLWMIGSGTWYYFVPMLLLNYIIFRFIKKLYLQVLIVLIGCVSIILTAIGIINCDGIINNYLNVFNWIPFFGIGVLLRLNKNIYIEKLITLKFIKILALLIATVLLGIIYYNVSDISYWSIVSIPFELIAVLFLLLLSTKLRNSLILIKIGKNTYAIYLLHIQLAGFINSHIILPSILYFIKPVLVLMICFLLIEASSFIAKKTKRENILHLFGIRVF